MGWFRDPPMPLNSYCQVDESLGIEQICPTHCTGDHSIDYSKTDHSEKKMRMPIEAPRGKPRGIFDPNIIPIVLANPAASGGECVSGIQTSPFFKLLFCQHRGPGFPKCCFANNCNGTVSIESEIA